MKVEVTKTELKLLKKIKIDMAQFLYDKHLPTWMTADKVYKKGYWMTFLTGSSVYLVAYRGKNGTHQMYFNFAVRQIITDLPDSTVEWLIEQINTRQYAIYSEYLAYTPYK